MGFYQTRNRKFQKNSKKIQKIKQHHYGFFSSQNRLGMAEKERKEKKIMPMSSYPTRNREFQKNIQKLQKIKKHCYGFFLSQNKMGKAEKEQEKKNRSDEFLRDP